MFLLFVLTFVAKWKKTSFITIFELHFCSSAFWRLNNTQTIKKKREENDFDLSCHQVKMSKKDDNLEL